ncbi:MAG TPA: hypothetical protein VGC04_11345 [Cellulomonas sp.]
MPRFRHRPPAGVISRLDLPHGDAVLAGVPLADGGWAVASRRALHLLASDEAVPEAVTPWCDVDRGSMDPAARTLTVWWVSGTRRALTLPDDADALRFSLQFRDRVQQSVVHAVTVTLPDGGRAQVALRRDPDGRLFTQTLGDDSVDLADPEVAAALARAETTVREAAGLPA